MKKEYVKPQNRVVVLKDRLLDVVNPGSNVEGGDVDAKQNVIDDSDAYSDDVWED